jgi:hypothetical protein
MNASTIGASRAVDDEASSRAASWTIGGRIFTLQAVGAGQPGQGHGHEDAENRHTGPELDRPA